MSDRARQAVAFDTADLPTQNRCVVCGDSRHLASDHAIGGHYVSQPADHLAAEAAPSDAMASWKSRRPTGAELADAVRKLDGPDDDEDDDEDGAAEPSSRNTANGPWDVLPC